jgi:hypothetical protein
MVNMARAGATTPQIASVSGHSIDATQRILETFCFGTLSSPRPRSLGWLSTRRSGPEINETSTEYNALVKMRYICY